MAKPYRWALRVPEILENVKYSRGCYWSRQQIQSVFCVRRTAAAMIMRAVGGLHAHGLNLTVHTTELKKFLIAASKAMDKGSNKASRAAKLSAFMKTRQADAVPPPKCSNVLTMQGPDSVTVAELPSSIRLSEGEINIRFKTLAEGINLVDKLIRAITFDFNQFGDLCEPLAEERLFDKQQPESGEELAKLYKELEELERKKGLSLPI